MRFKTILLPVIDHSSLAAGFAAALPLAQAFAARLVGLHVMANLPSLHPAEATWHPRLLQEIEARTTERRSALHQTFLRLCADAGLEDAPLDDSAHDSARVSWVERRGEEPSVLAEFARQTDLIVTARGQEAHGGAARLAIEEAVARSGRPLLIASAAAPRSMPRAVVMAWNGSVEATRSLGFLLPLLDEAHTIRIVSVGEVPDSAPSAAEIAAALRRRGLPASHVALRRTRAPIAERLMEEVATAKADLLAMGAYSHARWREHILGGFTQHVIESCAVPVFLAN